MAAGNGPLPNGAGQLRGRRAVSSTTAREVQLRALEGWRGVTALLVVLFHLYVAHELFLQEWLRYSAPVLEFFFIISGFVMALGFSEKVKDGPTFCSFIIRRAGRVWPLHLAMLSLLLLIPFLRFILGTPGDLFSGKLSLEALPYQVLLIQTWWPKYGLSWNHPAWTLTGELFAYLIMAIILLFSKSERTRWVLSLLVLGIAFTFYHQAMLRAFPDYNVGTVSRAVAGFFIGFLLYHAWRRYPLRNRTIAHILEIATVIGFAALLNWHPTGLAYFLSHALFVLLIYAFASDLGIISRFLSFPLFQWLGSRSFSIYMFHGVVTTWIMLIIHAVEARMRLPLTGTLVVPGGIRVHVAMLPQQWMNDALTLGYIAVVLIGASYIYRWVENPSRFYFANLANSTAKKLRESHRIGQLN